jgi:hypothetical protein
LCEGKCAARTNDTPRLCNKHTERTQGKPGIKLRKIYDGDKKNVIAAKIVLVNLKYNHKFTTEVTEKQHLRCNKNRDLEFMEFVGAMHDSRFP